MISLKDEIQKRYDVLTPSYRKVAEHLFDHQNDILVLNATQLANKANVSEATLTRFVTSFGFSGFSEFKRELCKQILQEHSITVRLTQSAKTLADADSVFNEILNLDIANIKLLKNNISVELFETTVSKLSSAKTIYVLGSRTSFTCSFYFSFSLRFFMNSVKLVTPNVADIADQFLGADNKDVLVAFSFRRYTDATIKTVEFAKHLGIYVIAVTNSELSPLAQLADLTLIVKTDIPSFAQSYTAPISLITSLVTALSLKNKSHVSSSLEELERNHELFGTFYR